MVTSQAAQIKYLSIHQGNKSLLEYQDKVKSTVAIMQRANAQTVTPCIVAEIAAANVHDVPTEADIREVCECDVAVRFVMHSNYRKYIEALSNDHFDNENKYPRTLALAYEIMHLCGLESSRPKHQAGVSFTNAGVGALESTVVCIHNWNALVVTTKVIAALSVRKQRVCQERRSFRSTKSIVVRLASQSFQRVGCYWKTNQLCTFSATGACLRTSGRFGIECNAWTRWTNCQVMAIAQQQ